MSKQSSALPLITRNFSWSNECPICHECEIDTDCSIFGRWKAEPVSLWSDKLDFGEKRFHFFVCIDCFDNIRMEMT